TRRRAIRRLHVRREGAEHAGDRRDVVLAAAGLEAGELGGQLAGLLAQLRGTPALGGVARELFEALLDLAELDARVRRALERAHDLPVELELDREGLARDADARVDVDVERLRERFAADGQADRVASWEHEDALRKRGRVGAGDGRDGVLVLERPRAIGAEVPHEAVVAAARGERRGRRHPLLREVLVRVRARRRFVAAEAA